MTKKIFILFTIFLVLLSACDLSIGDATPYLGSAEDHADYIDTKQEADADTTGLTLAASPIIINYGVSGLKDLSAQVLDITFDGGIVDASSINGAISIAYCENAASATETYVLGTAIPYSASVINIGGGQSKVRLSFDLSGAITDKVYLEIASTLTANNGNALFNIDGDVLLAETVDDIAWTYQTILDDDLSGNVVDLTTGMEKILPAYNFSFAADSTAVTRDLAGAAELSISFSVTNNDYVVDLEKFTADSLGSSFVFEKYTIANDSWASSSSWVTAYDNITGKLTFTNSNPVEGEIFRYYYNENQVSESVAYLGALHKVSTNNEIADTIPEEFRIVNTTATTAKYDFGSVTLTRKGDQANQYAKVVFNSANNLVFNENIFADAITFTLDNIEIDYDSVVKIAASEFYFYFPTGLINAASEGKALTIKVKPLLTVENTIADPDDNQLLGNTNTATMIMTSTDSYY